VVVGVPDDQSARSQRQDGDVAVDLVPVEGGLVMDDEIDKILFTNGLHDGVFDQLREVPAGVDLRPQLASRRSQPHKRILWCCSR
jgi:hypothetical protein